MDTRPMSRPQHSFITKLLADRTPDLDTADGLVFERYMDFLDGSKFIAMSEASLLIDWLKTQPKKSSPQVNTAGQALEPGVYVLGDHIVKLQMNKAGTNAYTSRWVDITGERLNENDAHVKGEWQYEPGLKGQLRPEHRMTYEQAKMFTLRYRQCVKCGRKLKAAQSVEEGIGSTCKKYFTIAA
jgi:hypothetical protein